MARNDNRDDTDSFLMGGESIPALFKKAHGIGSVFEGVVLDKEMRQQTDAKTREPKFWDDGNKMMQMVVTLQTDYDDEPNEDDEDDGRRRLYVKGAMQKAIADACRKVGLKGLPVGATVKIKYTGDAKPSQRGLSGAKQFIAKVTPPEPGSEDGDFFDDEQDDPPPRNSRGRSSGRSRQREEEPADDDFDDDPPAKKPARKAAAKKTASRGRRQEPVDDDFDDDPPARGRGRGRGRSQQSDDGDEFAGDDPGF